MRTIAENIHMPPEAKSALAKKIRELRSRLLDDLHAALEGAYRLSLKPEDAKPLRRAVVGTPPIGDIIPPLDYDLGDLRKKACLQGVRFRLREGASEPVIGVAEFGEPHSQGESEQLVRPQQSPNGKSVDML